MRYFSAALLLVVLVPVPALATCTGGQPNLCISVNSSAFQAGDGLSLTATVIPVAAPATVDVYVALRLPAGTLLFLQGNGTFTSNWTPFASGWTPAPFSGKIFAYTFGGGEPGGSYTWFAGFANQGMLNWIGNVAGVSFQFTPPPANVGGIYGLSGSTHQTNCWSGFNGFFQTIGQVSFSQSGTTLTGSASLTTQTVFESSMLQLSGTVSGNTISGSFTSTTFFNGTPGLGSGMFSGTLTGSTLAVTVSGTVTGTTCGFNLSLSGNHQ